MEKRGEPSDDAAGAGSQTKKIKTERAGDDLPPSAPSARQSASPHPSGEPRGVSDAAYQAAMTNLDRLANLAAQRTEPVPGSSTPTVPLRMDNSLFQTPTGVNTSNTQLPLSLQRLQAVRQAQGATTPGGAPASQASSYEQLVDVMGYSGVDLRAEEAFIQSVGQGGASWDDTSAILGTANLTHGLYLNVYPLSTMVHRIAKQYGLKVDAAALDYLSVATRLRFRNLVEAMVRTSRHRAWSSHQRRPPLRDAPGPDGQRLPLYHEKMLSNPTKQLAAIEKAERIEEGNWRRMRLEREEAEAAALEAGGDDGTPRAKKRASTSSRNLSEDVRKRLADSTAMRHLGANSVNSKYAWLQSPGMRSSASRARDADTSKDAADTSVSSKASALPKPKFAPAGGARLGAPAAHAGAWSDVATRQAAQREQERVARARVTLRDALAALEREHATGAGHGAGRRSAYLAHAYQRGRGSL